MEASCSERFSDESRTFFISKDFRKTLVLPVPKVSLPALPPERSQMQSLHRRTALLFDSVLAVINFRCWTMGRSYGIVYAPSVTCVFIRTGAEWLSPFFLGLTGGFVLSQFPSR